jgi:hypothetical protein
MKALEAFAEKDDTGGADRALSEAYLVIPRLSEV